MKTLLSISLLAIVAMTLTAPAIAQLPNPNPPRTFTWTIALVPVVADGGSGTAQYTVVQPTPLGKPFTKFSVECQYLKGQSSSPTSLDVFVGTGRSVDGQYGKLVGHMQLFGGYGELVLLNARTPVITKGTRVFINIHDGAPIMIGRF